VHLPRSDCEGDEGTDCEDGDRDMTGRGG
jgi:hypothetical protein